MPSSTDECFLITQSSSFTPAGSISLLYLRAFGMSNSNLCLDTRGKIKAHVINESGPILSSRNHALKKSIKPCAAAVRFWKCPQGSSRSSRLWRAKPKEMKEMHMCADSQRSQMKQFNYGMGDCRGQAFLSFAVTLPLWRVSILLFNLQSIFSDW